MKLRFWQRRDAEPLNKAIQAYEESKVSLERTEAESKDRAELKKKIADLSRSNGFAEAVEDLFKARRRDLEL